EDSDRSRQALARRAGPQLGARRISIERAEGSILRRAGPRSALSKYSGRSNDRCAHHRYNRRYGGRNCSARFQQILDLLRRTDGSVQLLPSGRESTLHRDPTADAIKFQQSGLLAGEEMSLMGPPGADRLVLGAHLAEQSFMQLRLYSCLRPIATSPMGLAQGAFLQPGAL